MRYQTILYVQVFGVISKLGIRLSQLAESPYNVHSVIFNNCLILYYSDKETLALFNCLLNVPPIDYIDSLCVNHLESSSEKSRLQT